MTYDKQVIEGYVLMNTDIESCLPPIISKEEFANLLNKGLWDKVTVTIEKKSAI